VSSTMRAWIVDAPGPAAAGPLRLVTRPSPEPHGREVLVRVHVCGVCRTDLHLAEGDLPPRRHGVVPGHEVIGTVEATGALVRELVVGERVGVPWLRWTCGRCRWCLEGRENLCTAPAFTGWDADGGFADLAVVDERFAHRIPASISDHDAAPLLCAGIIGYRALRRSRLPDGGRLGIYGFGASAHLTAQVALAEGATVHVLTRSEAARALALRLGCASAGPADGRPPEPLDAAILFAPVGDLVPVALRALDRGATLAVAGIHLTDIPPRRYAEHLFQERQLRSVTANTRHDGEEFLAVAERVGIRVDTAVYPFERADVALDDLAHDRFTGAAVLQLSDDRDGR
jgi:propanol-preferring alcohol dehydrogenase